MNIQLIYDDIRFTRYRMTCVDVSAALRTAMKARIASLERQLTLLKEPGVTSFSYVPPGWS